MLVAEPFYYFFISLLSLFCGCKNTKNGELSLLLLFVLDLQATYTS